MMTSKQSSPPAVLGRDVLVIALNQPPCLAWRLAEQSLAAFCPMLQGCTQTPGTAAGIDPCHSYAARTSGDAESKL